jgi:hypothetical protein
VSERLGTTDRWGPRSRERERARAKRNGSDRSAPQSSERERGERACGRNRLTGGGCLSAQARADWAGLG